MVPVGDEVRRRSFPALTYVLITCNVLVFVYSMLRGLEAVVGDYGFRPKYLLTASRLETLFTSLFVHGGPAHLAGNMLFLYIFGRSVEDRLGPLRFTLLYLLSGVAGNVVHAASAYLMLGPLAARGLYAPAVGASGAISGVMGAYIVFYPRMRVKTLLMLYYVVVLRVPAYLYVLAWFAYQLLTGLVSLGIPLTIAAWAHIGGFAAGAALAFVAQRWAARAPSLGVGAPTGYHLSRGPSGASRGSSGRRTPILASPRSTRKAPLGSIHAPSPPAWCRWPP